MMTSVPREARKDEASAAVGPRLRVDPIACDGVGICSHLAPELITMDSWGYPIVDARSLDARLLRKAKSAIGACPKEALFLAE